MYIYPDMTQITRERYKKLTEAELMLNSLYGAGVDNWDGWDEAVALFEEMKQEYKEKIIPAKDYYQDCSKSSVEACRERVKKLKQQLGSAKIELLNICPHDNLKEEFISHYSEFDEYIYTCLDCGRELVVNKERGI